MSDARSRSETIQHLLRELTPQVLGALVRRFGDFAASEDAVQDASIAAASQWQREGIPDSPRGWLVHVASRRMVDQARAEIARRRREALVVSMIPPEDQLAFAPDQTEGSEHDDTLDLLFMCCHPVLSSSSSIALTLRAIGGLTTAEIARAFMVPEATMAQRIGRAKHTIATSGIPFEKPDGDERAARLGAVMHVLYLVFNEGYSASSGDEVHRLDLSSESIRLCRLLHRLAPDDSEAAGLLALMLLTDARREARTGPAGELVPLDEQDRTQWDRASIMEGVALLESTLERGRVGSYQLQAAIAAVHDQASSTDETDWAEIVGLYGLLGRISNNPMVSLNHAIAVAMVQGPHAGLALLDAVGLDPRLREGHRLEAVRAHLLERAGDENAATACYRRAAERTTSTAERNYLLGRAARLRG